MVSASAVRVVTCGPAMLKMRTIAPGVRPVTVSGPSVGFGYAINEPSCTMALATGSLVTVTAQDATFAPSAVVTVIAAMPVVWAVTVPAASTDATAALLDDHVTAWFVAVAGAMVAVLFGDSLIYTQRERLINQGVYFIISDKYAFLPSLIVNAQLKKKEKLNRLTPVAQYL